MTKRFLQFCAVGLTLLAFSGCSTVTEMVEANIPNRENGRPSIVISLRAQEAYLYRGKLLVASSRISSGREGHRTPIGRFRVVRKDLDHTSGLYGDYVDDSGRVVVANVDTRKHRRPPHTHYEGAPMPFTSNSCPATVCTKATSRASRLRMAADAVLESAPVLPGRADRDAGHGQTLAVR